jgi:hypothetical protein
VNPGKTRRAFIKKPPRLPPPSAPPISVEAGKHVYDSVVPQLG